VEHVRLGRLLLRNGGLREDLIEAVDSERARLRPGKPRRAVILAGVVVTILLTTTYLCRRGTAPFASRPVASQGAEARAHVESLAAKGGPRPLAEAVALAGGGAAWGFETRGDWRSHDGGLLGAAREGEDPVRAAARADVPEEFRLRMKYRCDERCDADLLVSTGQAGSSARFSIPADAAGVWRTIEVLAIDGRVRCMVDDQALVPSDAAPQSPRRFIGVAVERGSLSIGETTLEQVLLENRNR